MLGVLLLCTGIVLFAALDPFIRSLVAQKVVIDPSSVVYNIWQDIPVPVYMQFWLFNITNKDVVLAGGKPVLKQLGPFTYRERRPKYDIVWNKNDTVTYKQNRTFTFVLDKSQSSDSTTMITTINPLLPVVAEGVKSLPGFVKSIMMNFLNVVYKEELIFTRSAREVLFGYDDPALSQLMAVLPKYFNRKNLGYFIRKNYTDDGLYTIFTGKNDYHDLGFIDNYNGKKSLSMWTTPWANMVNGTDGSLGPPFRFTETNSPIFVSDICRSINGVYKEDVFVKDIRLRRYGGSQFDMANATANPDNIGYCTPKGTPAEKCVPSGILNSTVCQEPIDNFPLPIFFSFPHFLYADPKVQDSVIGLSANEAEHQTVTDQEPWTGLVLQVAKRLQINIYVEKFADTPQTKNVSTTFFPILWINESSVVDDERIDLLNNMLFTPKQVAETGRIVATALGGIMTLVFGIWVLVHRKEVKRQANTKSRPNPSMGISGSTDRSSILRGANNPGYTSSPRQSASTPQEYHDPVPPTSPSRAETPTEFHDPISNAGSPTTGFMAPSSVASHSSHSSQGFVNPKSSSTSPVSFKSTMTQEFHDPESPPRYDSPPKEITSPRESSRAASQASFGSVISQYSDHSEATGNSRTGSTENLVQAIDN